MNANERLVFVIKETQLRQGDVAYVLDIRQGSLSDILRGNVGVSTKISRKVCEVANVNEVHQ
jgi:predicted XRE-type DNA-binding protein